MDKLQDNDKIAQLLDLLEKSERQGQAADLRQLCGYVDSLEKQYAAVLAELQRVKGQLSEAAEENLSLSFAVRATETRLERVQEQFSHLKNRLITWAEYTASDFMREGVSALDNIVAILAIRQALERVQDRLKAAARGVQSIIVQVEKVGHELRETGSHLANAGRAAVGREIRQEDTSQEGRFQAVVLAPLRGIKRSLSVMDRTADAALSQIERLERTAEQGRGKRERPSVRQRLEQRRETVAPPQSPQRAKKKSEVAL